MSLKSPPGLLLQLVRVMPFNHHYRELHMLNHMSIDLSALLWLLMLRSSGIRPQYLLYSSIQDTSARSTHGLQVPKVKNEYLLCSPCSHAEILRAQFYWTGPLRSSVVTLFPCWQFGSADLKPHLFGLAIPSNLRRFFSPLLAHTITSSSRSERFSGTTALATPGTASLSYKETM